MILNKVLWKIQDVNKIFCKIIQYSLVHFLYGKPEHEELIHKMKADDVFTVHCVTGSRTFTYIRNYVLSLLENIVRNMKLTTVIFNR